MYITQLLDAVGSVDTVRSVLKHILDLVSFSVTFPKLSKTLLKVRLQIVAYIFCPFTTKCMTLFISSSVYFSDNIMSVKYGC